MATRRVPAWDGLVRLLHWLLAALVAVDLVRDDGDHAHRLVGYAAAAVVLARLGWAAVSRSHARLASLRPSVSQSLAYLRLLLRGAPPRSIGHNPLGLWMVWLIWLLVLLLGLTGWMSRLDALWGDDGIRYVHAWLADGLLAAVILHLLGVAAMSLMWRENLPLSMVTGYKRSSSSGPRASRAPQDHERAGRARSGRA
jgi:cytochrome b